MDLCVFKHCAYQFHQLVMVAQIKSVAIAIRWCIVDIVGILVRELVRVYVPRD